MGQLSLWCPSDLHLVHHKSSWNYFPFLISWSCMVRLANYEWIYIIPAPPSSIEEHSSFIIISSAFVCDTILCCIKEAQICGNSAAINHSLCCTSDIWKLTLAIKVVNLWSTSHTDSTNDYLISFSYVIHCDSDFSFLNSSVNPNLISANVFCGVLIGIA